MPGLFTRVHQFTLGRPPTPVEVAYARARSILELGRHPTKSDVRSAYRRLSRKYHPDRFAYDASKASVAQELFVEIHHSYKLLTRTQT